MIERLKLNLYYLSLLNPVQWDKCITAITGTKRINNSRRSDWFLWT